MSLGDVSTAGILILLAWALVRWVNRRASDRESIAVIGLELVCLILIVIGRRC